MPKSRITMILKIIVAVALLAWFLIKSDVGQIFEHLNKLPLGIFLLALAINLVFLILKAWRWSLLLPDFRLSGLVKLNFIGQLYAVISAGQFAGEAAKIYIMGKGQVYAGRVAMSVLIDKLSGIIGLLIMALLGLIFTSSALPKSMSWTLTALALACLILIFSARLKFAYEYLTKLLNRRLSRSVRFKKAFGILLNLLLAWRDYSKKSKIIFFSVLTSLVLQIMLIGVYQLLGLGLGINISFWDWCWLTAVVGGLTVLPITIGGLGVREASLVGLLGYFTVAPEKALALSFSLFGLQVILAAAGAVWEIKRIKIFKLPNN